MRRIPVLATLIVAAAVLVMIGLGIWQLQRLQEKRALLKRYESAHILPEMAWPATVTREHAPLYRHASGFCQEVVGWRAISGRSLKGEPGIAHIAQCRTGGLEGPGMAVAVGWSRDVANPDWTGGKVEGVIGPDSQHIIRLVATEPLAGLEPVQPPSPTDIPNNHLSYAIQWFFFALVAVVIYILALRKRSRTDGAVGKEN